MTFAQFVGSGSTGIIGTINLIVVPIIGALIGFFFIYKVMDAFLLHPDDEKKRTEGRSLVIWGILGIVFFFSVWGIVNLALSTLQLSP